MGDEAEPLTQRAGRGPEAQRLEAWVVGRLAVPFERRATLSESERLERWVRGALEQRASLVAQPVAPAAAVGFDDARALAYEPPPFAPRPLDPLAVAEPMVAKAPAPTAAAADTRGVSRLEPLPLDVYARIKVAGWRGGDGLEAALAREGIDEVRWREHEAWLREELTATARRRDASLVRGVAEAIRRARSEGRRTAPPTAPDLEHYARLRAAVELAGEEHEDEALSREGVTRFDWDELRIDWAERLQRDPELSRRVRKSVGKARRAILAARETATDAVSA